MKTSPQIVVAGHICLDLIPQFPAGTTLNGFRSGAMYNVGPATLATGGAVANTGLALHRLGINTSLMGKVGDDLLGQTILSLIRAHGESLTDGMKISAADSTSYTVVLSPPSSDRTFIHCPGCNDTFTAEDLNERTLAQAQLMHFGYPTLMRKMYENGGTGLVELLRCAKQLGVTTSLDMTSVDPASDAGKVDWRALLSTAGPYIDCFVPSVEEILFMLNRPMWDELMQRHGGIDAGRDISAQMLMQLVDELISMGCAMVMLKLGDQGAYLKTSANADRFRRIGRALANNHDQWIGQSLAEPCFKVPVAGTTGSGDCTIAGFLTGLVRGFTPVQAMQLATAVGAFNVETVDAVSGVPKLEKVLARVGSGWEKHPSHLADSLRDAAAQQG